MFSPPDDQQLFERFRERGDVRALARLVERTAPELLRLAQHLVRDAHEAEDLVQTTYLTALESAQQYQPGRPVVAWLVGILVHRARALRRRRATRATQPLEEQARDDDPGRAAEERELDERLRASLAGLGPPYREVLHLHLIHGLDARDIAGALDRPPATVRTQIARGLERLRAALPASLAPALFVAPVPTRRAVAALRDTVVSAAGGVPAAPLALGLGGLLAVKTVVAPLLLVAGAAALFLGLRERDVPLEVAAPASVAAQPRPAAVDAPALGAPVAGRAALGGVEVDPGAASAAAPAEAGCTLLVHVVFDDRAPAGGAHIVLRPHVADWQLSERLAVADADGRARFTGLEAGTWTARSVQGGEARTTLLAGAEGELTLVVPAGVQVAGVVVDHRERPVPGAQVWLSASSSSLDQGYVAAETDARGRFRLRDVAPGRALGAFARGFNPAPVTRIDAMSGPLDVTLRLTGAGRAIVGRVFGADGAALPGAALQVGWTQGMNLVFATGACFPTRRLKTDEQGYFRVDGIDDSYGELPLWVRAAGHAVHTRTVDLGAPGDVHADVHLVRGATVTGALADADGAPCADASVQAFQDAVEPPLTVAYQGPPWARRQVATDADGRYELRHVHPGAVRLVAESDERRAVEQVELADGQVLVWNAVLASAAELRGVVVDSSGAPLAGWDVWARGERGVRSPPNARTDANGAFVLSGCDDAPYQLHTRTIGMDRATATLDGARPGPQVHRFVIPADAIASAFLAGRVLGAEGQALDDIWVAVSLVRGGRQANGSSQRAGGSFRIGPLPPGHYTVRVAQGEGYPSLSLGAWDVAAGETLDLGTHRFETSGHAHVTVTDAAGEPLEAGSLTLARDGEAWADFLQLERGEARSNPLQPGTYRLQLWGANVALQSQPVEIRAGLVTRAHVVVAEGVVRTLRFAPVAAENTMVLIEWWRDGELVQRHDSFMENVGRPLEYEQRFVPGAYRVRLTLASGSSAEARFDVDGADRPGQVLELPVPEGW